MVGGVGGVVGFELEREVEGRQALAEREERGVVVVVVEGGGGRRGGTGVETEFRPLRVGLMEERMACVEAWQRGDFRGGRRIFFGDRPNVLLSYGRMTGLRAGDWNGSTRLS
jgi:hypothetical protein